MRVRNPEEGYFDGVSLLSSSPHRGTLGLVLSLFGLSSGAVADTPAATYSFTILDVPGAASTVATSINDSGQVTGSYYDGSGEHGFVYSGGTFTTLDVPGATNTRPQHQRERPGDGLLTPMARITHGFVYSNGTFTTFDVPGAD